MKYDYCSDCREVVTWYSIGTNIFLVIFKGALGVMTGCAALVADAFHSMADVIASGVTMISLRISNRPADEKHTYGYGKIQHISSGIVGLILLAGACVIMVNSVRDIILGQYDSPEHIAFFGALVSVFSNELMYRYQFCVGTENNSPAILANAWDNRSDALSSIGVMVGIVFATFLGFPIADPLAAIAVSVLVMRISTELLTESVSNLMDSTPEVLESEVIYKIVRKFPKVMGVNYFRARSLGQDLYVEIDVQVDDDLKVFEGDLIVEALKQTLNQKLDNIGEIQIVLSPVME
ncbi:MAG: magnetosome biogenesis CDF transporter MamB [Magnetococcales bacterium]|nr:magnetosome biogenesis CDF transporter MamB [Magnetococcales bacterium]